MNVVPRSTRNTNGEQRINSEISNPHDENQPSTKEKKTSIYSQYEPP